MLVKGAPGGKAFRRLMNRGSKITEKEFHKMDRLFKQRLWRDVSPSKAPVLHPTSFKLLIIKLNYGWWGLELPSKIRNSPNIDQNKVFLTMTTVRIYYRGGGGGGGVIVVADYGVVMNRRPAIIWPNTCPIYGRTYGSLGLDLIMQLGRNRPGTIPKWIKHRLYQSRVWIDSMNRPSLTQMPYGQMHHIVDGNVIYLKLKPKLKSFIFSNQGKDTNCTFPYRWCEIQ